MEIFLNVEVKEFWNQPQKLKKDTILFCLAMNELKFDLNAPLIPLSGNQSPRYKQRSSLLQSLKSWQSALAMIFFLPQ